jgi:hypothetical protein
MQKIYFYWELPHGNSKFGKIIIPKDEKGSFSGFYQSIPEALSVYFATRGKKLIQILNLRREGHDEFYTEYYYSADVEVE